MALRISSLKACLRVSFSIRKCLLYTKVRVYQGPLIRMSAYTKVRSTILSPCNFVKLLFYQFTILSNCYIFNLKFFQLAVFSPCHFLNRPLNQLAILLTSHWVLLPFFQMAVLLNNHFVSM